METVTQKFMSIDDELLYLRNQLNLLRKDYISLLKTVESIK